MEQKLDQIMNMLQQMNSRFDTLELKMELGFQKNENQFNIIGKHMNRLEDKINHIQSELKETKNIKKLYSEEALKAVEAV